MTGDFSAQNISNTQWARSILLYILLYVCPHPAIYASSYCYIYVLILLYMCPHTTVHCMSGDFSAQNISNTVWALAGTQFTCFTGTKVQIMTAMKAAMKITPGGRMLGLLSCQYLYFCTSTSKASKLSTSESSDKNHAWRTHVGAPQL